MDAAMKLIIDLRATARARKDWETSDKIRDELQAAGIQLKDGADGTTFTTK
jgi:cysteinyl-tRNA synthetase